MYATIATIAATVLGLVFAAFKLIKTSATGAQAKAAAQAYTDANAVTQTTADITEATRTTVKKETDENATQTANLAGRVGDPAAASSLSDGSADLNAAIKLANSRHRTQGRLQ